MGFIEDKIKQCLEEGSLFKEIERAMNVCDYKEALAGMRAIGRMMNPNFVLDKDNRFVYENLAKWFVGDSTFQCNSTTNGVQQGSLFKGIYIGGATGSGKSMAMAILMEMARLLNLRYQFGEDNIIRLYDAGCLATDICEDYAISGDLSECKRKDVLLINDMGAEPQEVLYMGNRLPIMRTVIEARGDAEGKFTFITSNLPMQGEPMLKRYGDRVESRLVQMCNFFYLGGKDRRK